MSIAIKFSLKLVAIFTCYMFLIAYPSFASSTADSLEIEVNEEDFTIERYRSDGNKLLIFISAGLGLQERVNTISRGVADQGIEFWHVNLADNLFLPNTASSFRMLDGRHVKALIQKGHELTGKKVILMSHAYASIPTLRGVREWQKSQNKITKVSTKQSDNYFSGVILLSPDLFNAVPDLGLEPEFSAIAGASNIPVYIMQSGNRSNRWQLENVVAELRKGGAVVYSKVFPGVTGIFYGEDKSMATKSILESLPVELSRAIKLLEKTAINPVLPKFDKDKVPATTSLDMTLKPFKGNAKPPELDLISVRGQRRAHVDYKKKVTLVNFWATWCGACVEEIPSLNRLLGKINDPRFELISVDYAEDKATIMQFLQDVNVDFPVLLDSDGKISASWNVHVFPSTFVIGTDGNIIYGVRGGLLWDDPAIIRKLEAVLKTV